MSPLLCVGFSSLLSIRHNRFGKLHLRAFLTLLPLLLLLLPLLVGPLTNQFISSYTPRAAVQHLGPFGAVTPRS